MPMPDMAELLKACVEREASDLHIAVGRPPVLRVDGKLVNMELPPLMPADTRRLIYSVLTDLQKQRFEENMDLDFSLSIANLSRFRVNAHLQRGSVAGAFRTIPSMIRNFDDLNLPSKVMQYFARRPSGLVPITGPTGSGKSTTLAAIIDLINSERELHIITVEDPIEYLHSHKRALIEQRELNEDTISFASALKHVLRQDPDVILVGEMRDLETIGSAITAAETGHLVFSTLHTIDVVQTIDRVIDVFPPHQQEQMRIQLSAVIEGVVSQRLLPLATGRGRTVVCEIMVATDGIRNLIREGKTHQIYALIEAGAKYHMQTLDRALMDLYKRQRIARETLMLNCRKAEEVKRLLSQQGVAV